MRISFNGLIRSIIIIFSAYLVSQGLFFLIGPMVFQISFDCHFVEDIILLYLLVLLNIIGNLWIFLMMTITSMSRFIKSTVAVMTMLSLVTIVHLAASNLKENIGVAICEEYFALQGLSMETLYLLVLYGFYFLRVRKKLQM